MFLLTLLDSQVLSNLSYLLSILSNIFFIIYNLKHLDNTRESNKVNKNMFRIFKQNKKLTPTKNI